MLGDPKSPADDPMEDIVRIFKAMPLEKRKKILSSPNRPRRSKSFTRPSRRAPRRLRFGAASRDSRPVAEARRKPLSAHTPICRRQRPPAVTTSSVFDLRAPLAVVECQGSAAFDSLSESGATASSDDAVPDEQLESSERQDANEAS